MSLVASGTFDCFTLCQLTTCFLSSQLLVRTESGSLKWIACSGLQKMREQDVSGSKQQRETLKGSKETSTKLCVIKRLLSIADATAHEITPGDYAKKGSFATSKRWAQSSRTASSGIWPPHCNTTFGSQASGQNGLGLCSTTPNKFFFKPCETFDDVCNCQQFLWRGQASSTTEPHRQIPRLYAC